MERVDIGGTTVLVGDRGGKYPSGNSILVEDDVTVVVDPSTSVVAADGRIGRGPIDVVVNSHAHEDHFAGNFLFPDAELCLHERDAPAMGSLEALFEAYGLDEASEALFRPMVVEQYNFRPRKDVRAVRDGETMDLGRNRLTFLHTPGHTAGHLCVLVEPDGVLFTGDLDLTWFGPYYADATASLEDTIASLVRIRDLEGVRALVSFHEAGIVREDLAGCVQRYLDVVWERDAKLLDYLAEPHTIDEVAQQCFVYRKRYEKIPWQLHVEGVMMGRHAARLERLGHVARDGDRLRAI